MLQNEQKYREKIFEMSDNKLFEREESYGFVF